MAEKALEPDWLSGRRRKGASLAQGLSLPGPKAKGWEFIDLTSLNLDSFAEAAGGDGASAESAQAILPAPDGSAFLRQVDSLTLGSELEEPSGNGKPSEPTLMPLADAAARYPGLVREHLGSIVPANDIFVARNDASWAGGAFVYVPAGQRFEMPIGLSAIQGAAGSTMGWRSLIVLEEGAEAEVWEQYLAGDPEADALFNGVTEISVGQGANLRFVCGQDLSDAAWVFATQRAEVDRDASLDWLALGFGSGRGKVRMETKLAGRGSSAKVTGAYAGLGIQHLDYDTTQEHAAPNTVSDLAFRGVLSGRSTSVWRGMIRVDRDAQQTDAFQESRNLLLSPRAHADAIPGLEIEADDVRCTHAAAVAQVDPEQLYYLRSRGLQEPEAKRLVIDGFLQELVERTVEGPIRTALAEALEHRLGELLAAA
ncbi:MAG: Fe-S cluster assembly protein SufD [Actinomycetota bacterium]|nr:Fe-S cluster assembly protein SufD [Actinomycetota bacterium]